MDLYILRPEELPNLERRLSSITLPPPKGDEALDVETFDLIRATPEIIERSRNTIYARLERGDDFRIHNIFFDKKRAFTYFILHYLGFYTTSDYVNEVKKNIEKAETSLTRFLSLYAPGPLSDTEGHYQGTIDGVFIHNGLSALFSPAGFFGQINMDSQHHTITYGHQPANVKQESGKAYLDEMIKAILNIRSTYGKLTKILIFLTELSGYHVDINQEVQRKYHEVRTQMDVVNSLLRELASSPDVFTTDEGFKNLSPYIVLCITLIKILVRYMEEGIG